MRPVSDERRAVVNRGRLQPFFLRSPRGETTMKRAFVILILLAGSIPAPLAAQDVWFGQNKVQYRRFTWTTFATEHFTIYYHQGGEEIARFAAVAAEQVYDELRRAWRYDLTRRVPIILYNSHNDFQQTNVIPNLLREGIEGFTEYLKHRVVVPFQGSYADFRHVLNHELVHAVSMAMIYGRGIGGLMSQIQSGSLPIWFVEGLAEYGSMGWDPDAESFVRDAVINGYLPELQDIHGGFLAYKGGQSFFHFLAQTYGQRRIGDLVMSLRLVPDIEQALVATVGRTVELISRDWQRFLQQTYWSEIEGRSHPEEIARPLTDHHEDGSQYNVFPALSPEGERLAFLSNRSRFMDLYIISTTDRTVITRLGKGERTGQFEQMHILRGGVSWSPDGERVAVAAKGGVRDRIYVVDAENGRVQRILDPELDGVYEPAWSPDGGRIAFVGVCDGWSDLYLCDLSRGDFSRLTHSKDYESNPAWSPDGTRLAFASDRVLPGRQPRHLDLPVSFGDRNIWIMELDRADRRTLPVITGTFDDTHPHWGRKSDELFFISFRSGIRNLYRCDLATGDIRAVTDVLTGLEAISYCAATDELVFSAFNDGGYDLWLLDAPRYSPVRGAPAPTRLVQQLELERFAEAVQPALPARRDSTRFPLDLSRLRAPSRPVPSRYREPSAQLREEIPLTRELGHGVLASEEHPYRLRLEPDLVLMNAGYNSYWGLSGASYMEMSDILGNHRISAQVSLWNSLENSNYQFTWTGFGSRLNVGASLFWYNYLYYAYDGTGSLYGDRTGGGLLYLSWPFSRFLRLDLQTRFIGILRRIYLTGPAERVYRQLIIPELSLVGDNTVPGVTGYINGRRFRIGLASSPPWIDQTLRFTTLSADYRSYLSLDEGLTLVLRGAGGVSEGREPQRFYLGGNGYWWGPRHSRAELYDIESLYFASFQSPLRGYDFYEFSGSRFALTNLELRFEFIRLLALGWPLPLRISNIQGALFCDLGVAWNAGTTVRLLNWNGLLPAFEDIRSGIGLGARMNLGFFILRFDVAWKNTLNAISGKPRWYIALGPEF